MSKPTGIIAVVFALVIGAGVGYIALREQEHGQEAPPTFAASATGNTGAYDGPRTIKVGGKYGYINRTGKIIVNPQFDSAATFSEGLASVCIGVSCGGEFFFPAQTKPDQQRIGYVDEVGHYVVNPQYDSGGSFSEGLAAVCEGDCGYTPLAPRKWGFIDTKGNAVIPLQFGDVYAFNEGLAAVCVGRCTTVNDQWEGKWGFIDKTGKLVITPQFDAVGNYEADIASASFGTGNDKKNGWIDKTGKFIWNPSN